MLQRMSVLSSTVVCVRTARKQDLDAIHGIEGRSFDHDRFSRGTLNRLLSAPTTAFLVADIDGEVAGYAAVLFRVGTRVARLYSIAVDPARRGLGVAAALIATAENAARARGSRSVRLEVRASNKAALSLYERAGFTFLERKPGYYRNGEDALRLEKRLEPCKAGGGSAF
jgi:[ribosomal protein S18]-alanine N-acetyltransferase